MRRVARWAVFLSTMALLAAGCSASRRPYAHDPLLRDGQGMWGDPMRGRTFESHPHPEPTAPWAPRPAELPTLDWEKASK